MSVVAGNASGYPEGGAFAPVIAAGLTFSGVKAATKYDGSPVLRWEGAFMAGLAAHRSAEPDTLVVRASLEDRERLLEEAPEIYYVTPYYRRHPVVLARLRGLEPDALHDLLLTSWRITKANSSRAASGAGREKLDI